MILIVNGGLLAASLALSVPAAPTDVPRVAGEPASSLLALDAEYLQRTRSAPSRSGTASRPKGSHPPARSGASANVNHSNATRNRNVNNTNVNRNVNRNTNVNRNVDVNVHNDYHGGGYYHDDWDDWDDHWHPAATIATAAVTAAVVGSIVNSVPPSCSTVVVNGISYSQCGSTWYQPQYVGSSVQYVVVNPPR